MNDLIKRIEKVCEKKENDVSYIAWTAIMAEIREWGKENSQICPKCGYFEIQTDEKNII